jgi:hypothetical protein
MNLLFDITATQPSQGKFHGAGEYAKAVFIHLLKVKKKNIITGIYNPDEWLDPDIKNLINNNQIKLHPVKNNRDIEELLKNEKFDKFYTALTYEYYNTDFSSTDFIFTLHGLRDLEMPTDRYEFIYSRNFGTLIRWLVKTLFPGFYKILMKYRFKKLIEKNKQLIVVSEHTKFSLISFFHELIPENIAVLYSPAKNVKSVKDKESKILDKYRINEKKYILLIGGNRWIKNPYRGIKALDEIFEEHEKLDYRVVVVGGKKLKSIFLTLKNKRNFIFTDYVEDYELEILYKNSHSFLYPTLNEGFGYPPIEAMKYGVPVACSAIASVTEICRDAAVFFNPFNTDEIKNRLLMLLFEKSVYNDYSKRSLKRYREISEQQDKMLDQMCRILLSKN